MQEQQTYGASFIQHLTALSRQTRFNFRDLQQIKAMTREDLAERLKVDCKEFAQIVLSNTPEDAATAVHQKTAEVASGFTTAQGGLGLLEILVQLFAASV